MGPARLPTSRPPELEALIERQPADDALHRAYALWLERRGDARGLLARLVPGSARHRAFVRQHAARLFGTCAASASSRGARASPAPRT